MFDPASEALYANDRGSRTRVKVPMTALVAVCEGPRLSVRFCSTKSLFGSTAPNCRRRRYGDPRTESERRCTDPLHFYDDLHLL